MAELEILDQLNLGVIDLDDNGCIQFANQAARSWLGRELTGSTFSDQLDGGSRLFFLNHLYPLLHTRPSLEEAYLSLKDAGGQELPVLLNGNRLARGHLRLTFMPVRRRAVIERQLLQAKEEAEAAALALREAQARLALQDRLAMMGTLAAGVAHELNNPLTYVIGNLELLQGSHLSKQERQSLADVNDGVRRIQAIVNSLKVLSRSEEERKVRLDLNHMAQIASRLGSKECALCCQLECSLHPQPVYVLGDEGKLTQVLLNLILNACQAFPRADLQRNLIRLHTWVEGEQACLELMDNGPGIPEEIRERIFDAFFTTKPVGSGTGLGLSICQGIVQSLGGRLELMPEFSGACFRLTLPLQMEPSTQTSPPATTEPRLSLEGLNCLIIDDDERVARVLKRVLSGCNCQIALGGERGLEMLSQQLPFDLIICDLMMPDLSGIQVYRAASPQHQRRFVFVTGGVTPDDESFIKSCGAPMLSKPFGKEKLVAAYAQLESLSLPPD